MKKVPPIEWQSCHPPARAAATSPTTICNRSLAILPSRGGHGIPHVSCSRTGQARLGRRLGMRRKGQETRVPRFTPRRNRDLVAAHEEKALPHTSNLFICFF